MNDPTTEYAQSVVDGSEIAGFLVRLACKRHLRDLENGFKRHLRFDVHAANKAIKFFRFLRHYKSEWKGKPFILAPFQAFIVGSIFGWKRFYGQCPKCQSWESVEPNSTKIWCKVCEPVKKNLIQPSFTGWFRRFTLAYIEIARKNGKSMLAAGIVLLMTFFDDEPAAEGYTAATKRDQAAIVFDRAKALVETSPSLRRRITVQTHALINSEYSILKALSRDASTMDGLDLQVVSVDEFHAHKSRDMIDVLETATGSRRQSLILIVTTAGDDIESVCWEYHEDATDMLEQVIDNDRLFAYIATIDKGDDWWDSDNWRKANPNLGVSPKFKTLKEGCDAALSSPRKQNNFRRKNINQWVEQTERWLSVEDWNACEVPGLTFADMIGYKCYGAFDLASTSDLTSFSAVYPPQKDLDRWIMLNKFWLPEDTIKHSGNRSPYRNWLAEGYLMATPGNVLDYAFIKEDFYKFVDEQDLISVAIDRWNATQLIGELDLEGIDVMPFGQGYQSMSPASKYFERLLIGHKIAHDGNLVMKANIKNVSVTRDPTDAIKPVKGGARSKKIDGVVAGIMAIGAARLPMKDKGPVIIPSGYRSPMMDEEEDQDEQTAV